jgi:hypothetical protein
MFARPRATIGIVGVPRLTLRPLQPLKTQISYSKEAHALASTPGRKRNLAPLLILTLFAMNELTDLHHLRIPAKNDLTACGKVLSQFVGAYLRGRPILLTVTQERAPTEGRPYKLGDHQRG